VIDLHSRMVVGWAIADHMRTELVTAALDMALANRKPSAGVIFHSDRGAQYTSAAFDTYCKGHGIRRSLGRTGICYDNAVSDVLRDLQEGTDPHPSVAWVCQVPERGVTSCGVVVVLDPVAGVAREVGECGWRAVS